MNRTYTQRITKHEDNGIHFWVVMALVLVFFAGTIVWYATLPDGRVCSDSPNHVSQKSFKKFHAYHVSCGKGG